MTVTAELVKLCSIISSLARHCSDQGIADDGDQTSAGVTAQRPLRSCIIAQEASESGHKGQAF